MINYIILNKIIEDSYFVRARQKESDHPVQEKRGVLVFDLIIILNYRSLELIEPSFHLTACKCRKLSNNIAVIYY